MKDRERHSGPCPQCKAEVVLSVVGNFYCPQCGWNGAEVKQELRRRLRRMRALGALYLLAPVLFLWGFGAPWQLILIATVVFILFIAPVYFVQRRALAMQGAGILPGARLTPITMSSRVFYGIISALLLGFGFILAWLAGHDLHANLATQKWPTVEGKVTSSTVEAHQQTSASRWGSRYRYVPHIQYEYEVGGRTYYSTQVWREPRSLEKMLDAQRVTLRYPQGASVPVYYHPTIPSLALLEPGAKWSDYLLFVVGLIFGGGGILALVFALHKP